MAGLEPASPCSQSTWVRRYPTSRCRCQSERADLNRRSPAPDQARYQASLRSVFSDPYRSRTGLAALKGRCPRTDRRTGRRRAHIFHAVNSWCCAHLSRSGPGGARIRVPWFSARCYTISATDPTKPTKKARCPYDTGLSVFFGMYGPVSHAQWIIGKNIRCMTGELFSRYPSLCDT